MELLNEHLHVKKKYYALDKYVMNKIKAPSKTMQRILDQHKCQFFGMRRFKKRIGSNNSNLRKTLKYQIATYALNKIIN
jgi:phage gp36-like protein